MLQIRWHSRAGQGAVTGAKGLADVLSGIGKKVQAFAFYGSPKRGALMTAYNRIREGDIVRNHEKFMIPDYVFVIDPTIPFLDDIFVNEKDDTKYIITTHLSKEELEAKLPDLKKREYYILDCINISMETIGKSVPNAPMLGAFVKVSNIMGIDDFKKAFEKVLGKKLPQKILDANMAALDRAYAEVH